MITENQKITDGNATFIVRKMGGVLRIDFISMFDGTFDNDGHPIDAITGLPDAHWHICDGTNGTPDLRDRFIVGSGNAYAIGNTGGEAKHQLTTDELPSHSHNGVIANAGNHEHTIGRGSLSSDRLAIPQYNDTSHMLFGAGTNLGFTSQSGTHTHSLTIGAVGGNQPHENRPPYYALAFIKKIK